MRGVPERVLPRLDGMAWARMACRLSLPQSNKILHHEGCFCSTGLSQAPCRHHRHVSSVRLACRYATNAVVPVGVSDMLIPAAPGLVSALCVSRTWRAAAAAPACCRLLAQGLMYTPSLAIVSES